MIHLHFFSINFHIKFSIRFNGAFYIVTDVDMRFNLVTCQVGNTKIRELINVDKNKIDVLVFLDSFRYIQSNKYTKVICLNTFNRPNLYGLFILYFFLKKLPRLIQVGR